MEEIRFDENRDHILLKLSILQIVTILAIISLYLIDLKVLTAYLGSLIILSEACSTDFTLTVRLHTCLFELLFTNLEVFKRMVRAG